MRLLTDAHLTDIVMDSHAVYNHWRWLDTRPPPVYGEGDPPEALRSAFRTLLDSITPRAIDRTLLEPQIARIRGNPVPGAFPVDDSDDDNFENGGVEDEGEDSEDRSSYSGIGEENGHSADANHDSERTDDGSDAGDTRMHLTNHPMPGPTVSGRECSRNCTGEMRARRSSI